MAAWFKLRARLRRSKVPLAYRIAHLFATLGVAFVYAAGGWTLSSEVPRLCNKLERSRVVPAYHVTRGSTWHELVQAATCAARTRTRCLGVLCAGHLACAPRRCYEMAVPPCGGVSCRPSEALRGKGVTIGPIGSGVFETASPPLWGRIGQSSHGTVEGGRFSHCRCTPASAKLAPRLMWPCWLTCLLIIFFPYILRCLPL